MTSETQKPTEAPSQQPNVAPAQPQQTQGNPGEKKSGDDKPAQQK